MSTTLCWEPVKPENPNYLGDGIKWALQKRYGIDVEAVLTNADIQFIEGVHHAQFKEDSETAQDCVTLISAIQQYGQVRIWLE